MIGKSKAIENVIETLLARAKSGGIPNYDDSLEVRRGLMAQKIKTWFEAILSTLHAGDQPRGRVMTALLKDDTQLFKQFSDNDSFKRWLTDTVFGMTYGEAQRP